MLQFVLVELNKLLKKQHNLFKEVFDKINLGMNELFLVAYADKSIIAF